MDLTHVESMALSKQQMQAFPRSAIASPEDNWLRSVSLFAQAETWLPISISFLSILPILQEHLPDAPSGAGQKGILSESGLAHNVSRSSTVRWYSQE